MADLDDMLDANFAEWGVDALYKVGGLGAGVTVRVIRTQPDAEIAAFNARLVSATTLLDLRAAEAATALGAAPKEGDTLTIGAETFRVQGKPQRKDRLAKVWTLDTVPA